MSRMKDKDDYYGELAFGLLSAVGAIKQCKYHDDWYYATGMDTDDVYKYATAKLKKKENNPDHKLFHKKIKEILRDAGEAESDCPFCKKIMNS